MTDLTTKRRLETVRYSERHTWEHHEYDPQLNAVATYHRRGDDSDEESAQKWRMIQAFAGSIDGRKALGFASLVRRYMHHCDSWWSSYRFILGVIDEIDYEVFFRSDDLKGEADVPDEEMRDLASWEVFYTRLSGIQEFGWHASIEALKFPMTELHSHVGGAWNKLKPILKEVKRSWEDMVINIAKQEGRFFPPVRFSEG